jgi:hypothetical protein
MVPTDIRRSHCPVPLDPTAKILGNLADRAKAVAAVRPTLTPRLGVGAMRWVSPGYEPEIVGECPSQPSQPQRRRGAPEGR